MIRAAVLGSPISHSLSPRIHNFAYAKLGISGEYSAIEVGQGELKAFLDTAGSSYKGFSLTMPLKEEALDISGLIDDYAHQASAINTLIRVGSEWYGYNTDVRGMIQLLSNSDLGDVHVLGGGATARSALVALRDRAAKVTVYRRSESRDAALRMANSDIAIRSLTEVREAFQGSLLINTLPINAFLEVSEIGEIIGSQGPTPEGLLLDALYAPWKPPLTRYFEERGKKVFSGIDLLISQAIEQIELFSELDLEKGPLFETIKQELLRDLSSN